MGDELELRETKAAPALLLKRGDLLAGRYRVLELLGAGGMGSVHRALDTELDEEVALKVLRSELANDPTALARFRREVRLARRVTHANVARTYDLGAHQGMYFLTMELIDGAPLSRMIRAKGRIPLAESLRIAAEIARGLAAAHVVGVIHRDLKPDNVMLTDTRVCLTDFGIARSTEAPSERESRPTVGAVGTPEYMAPEQVEGRELDGRADVYALGTLLFEALTGRLPFEASSPFAVAAMRLTSEPLDPRSIDPALPEPLARFVLSLLSRRREERPDAQTTLERIEILRGEGSALPGAQQAVRPESEKPGSRALTPGRWVVVSLVEAQDEASRTIAPQLEEALDEAFAGLSSFSHVPRSAVRDAGTRDEVMLARRVGADLVLHVSVRSAGDRYRTRLRLVERTDGRTLWQKRVDGDTHDPFALEDQLVAEVRSHFAERFSTPGTIERGPRNPELREIATRARALLREHRLESYEHAIALLEEGHVAAPDDPWIAGRLGAALIRRLTFDGASSQPDEDVLRAEELCLRALATDSSIGETYETLGVLRFMQGRMRNSVRAFREAIERDPFLPESHGYLARMLSESGRSEEAIERAHLVLRLDPSFTAMRWVLARIALLQGGEGFEEHLTEADRRLPGAWVSLLFRCLWAAYRKDQSAARRVLSVIEARPPSTEATGMIRWMRHVSGEETVAPDDQAFVAMVRREGTDRTRGQGWQLRTDILASLGATPDVVLHGIESAAKAIIDLTWFDRSPLLAGVRHDPRFAAARASVAARVADMWS